jgi:hypothetical protein
LKLAYDEVRNVQAGDNHEGAYLSKQIHERERRALEAENKAQNTHLQAESYRERMMEDRKRREEKLHQLTMEVCEVTGCGTHSVLIRPYRSTN